MSKRNLILLALAVVSFTAALVGVAIFRRPPSAPPRTGATRLRAPLAVRQAIFDLIQPVKLANCTLERFGEPHDGGYVMCANLLGSAKAAYSYGISGYDQWGCDISTRLKVEVHQYDCFNLTRPSCAGGKTVFHEECVGAANKTEEGRLFDSIESQFAKNGHAGQHLVVKMDVEGAEWDSLMAAPDKVLDQIDQLSIELHGVREERFVSVLKRLKQNFYIAHLHFNNYSCQSNLAPMPAWAYEVLFVNKRIGVPDTSGKIDASDSLDAPNNPNVPDCQSVIGVASR